jgi:hypothetical protein
LIGLSPNDRFSGRGVSAERSIELWRDGANNKTDLSSTSEQTGMELVRLNTDYGAVVRGTVLWAGVSAFIVVNLGLPLLILGPFVLIECPWTIASIGPIASGLFASALGALLLYSVLRCNLLSIARVWRSPGYPARHWWLVRRTYRRMARTELIFLSVLTAATVVACRSDGWLANRADLAVGIAGSVLVFYQLVVVASLNDTLRHASVVPYFPKRVGEISTFACGESLARHVDELDEIARTHAVAPLSGFGWNDDFEDEELVWHLSAAGLKTVNALLITLEREETGWADHAATIADLKQLAHALERADSQGIPFSLLLRHTTVTNGQEWENRLGTCF